MKDYHVFISYSREDDPNYPIDKKEFSPIGEIVECFKKAGIKPWIDIRGEYVGENYLREISKGINNSETMLFVSSKNSNTSYYAPLEVCKAADNKMKIFLLLLDDAPFHENIDLLFSAKDKRWFYPNPQKSLDDLASCIKKEIDRIKKKEEEEAERKRQEEEKEAERKRLEEEAVKEKERIEKLKKEISDIKNQIIEYVEKQQTCMKELLSKEQELNKPNKEGLECPVCQKTFQDMAIDFCDICGWHFSTPKELVSAEMQQLYDKRLLASKTNWTEKQQRRKEIETLKKDIGHLTSQKDELQKELDGWKEKYNVTQEECKKQGKAKQDEITGLKKELNESKSQLAKASKTTAELERVKKEYSEFKSKQNERNEENKKLLAAKNNELQKTAKELQSTKTLLAEAQRKANEAAANVRPSAPLAFLLVEEDGESNVYLLHEGTNVFGSMHAKFAKTEGYQTIVSSEPELRGKHFSLTSTGKGSFMLHVFDDAVAGKNSPSNTVNNVEVYCGDILYIGSVENGKYSGLRLYIKDNFNK